MTLTLAIHLRSLSEPLVQAWREEFAGVPGVTVSYGDIFFDRPGPVTAKDAIDVHADAVVSPANSFGFMDGGIDAVYTHHLGPELEARLRATLASRFGGELPVGQAIVVPTGHAAIPWCISAPTMRVPADVSDTVHAYLAMRAALLVVLSHNESAAEPIRSVLCPGLATGVGRMPPARCARQMREAWNQVIGRRPTLPYSLYEAMEEDSRLRA
ncbi:macro domain-containing protein [Polyangium sorediatum]|uniref:Macro domain-containing protein n=1 Tax=Polyangium sorediatum TaxID=889274 RepID=A0ABT6NQT5_9BACT|nr:macro domain-containing protein [Polyangium sorediatum]MDI1430692.1 macro domain-containing protein [Polyangium sorediatum]